MYRGQRAILHIVYSALHVSVSVIEFGVSLSAFLLRFADSVTAGSLSSLIVRFQELVLSFFGVWMSRVFLPKADTGDTFYPSISFGGGGMLWSWYLGVAHHIFKTYGKLPPLFARNDKAVETLRSAITQI